MKILKLIKNNIIGFVLGGIIIGSVTAGAATLFASSEVVYDNTNSGSNATNVKDALDELYDISSKWIKPNQLITHKGIVYYNPVSGIHCEDYVATNSLEMKKDGCMKWYIIGSSGNNIDLILDHNTSSYVYWNTNGSNETGPSETSSGKVYENILYQLKIDTVNWSDTLIRSDSYTDPAKGYVINYSGYKARLIEANEVADITMAGRLLNWDSGISKDAWYYLDGADGDDSTWQTQVATSQGESKYGWLYEHLWDCTKYGCNVEDNIIDSNGNLLGGYWTSSAVTGYDYNAWIVDRVGTVARNRVNTDSKYYGLRPVITIPKP